MLQTEEYAAAAIRATRPSLRHEEVSKLVEITQQRQQLIAGDGPEHHLIIDESALCRQIAPATVMHTQLRQLRESAENPKINIQIATFERAHYTVACSFTIVSFADLTDADVACHQSMGGQVTISKQDNDVAAAKALFIQLASDATSARNSPNLSQQIQAV